jgi:gluconate 5-dehydrogenase
MSTELFSLDGRVALITGGGGGLGFAMAKAMGEAGARVIVNGRRPDAVAQAAETLHAMGCSVD